MLTSDELDLDLKAGCEIAVYVVEDNTGACDGDFYISVLGSDLDPDGEGWQSGPTTGPVYTDVVASGGVIDPVQNTTRKHRFSISPADFGSCKIHVLNDSGQQLAVTINYRTADIPVAA